MTTLTHPKLTFRAGVNSFLAATLAAVALLVLFFWLMTGVTSATSDPGSDIPVPRPRAQVAPQPAQQAPVPIDHGSSAPVPNPRAQVSPPRPSRQATPTS